MNLAAERAVKCSYGIMTRQPDAEGLCAICSDRKRSGLPEIAPFHIESEHPVTADVPI